MNRYPLELLDSIGNKHARKDLCLAELAQLSQRLREQPFSQKAAVQKDLRQKRLNMPSHPYTKELTAFRGKEAALLSEIKKGRQERENAGKQGDRVLRRLTADLQEASELRNFYAPYEALCYDAELALKTAKIRLNCLPQIIERLECLDLEISAKEQNLAEIRTQPRAALEKQLRERCSERRQQYRANLRELRQKKKDGVISAKALVNESRMERLARDEDLAVIKLQNPIRALTENLKSLKHHRKTEPAVQEKVLLSDISDLRRKIPVEERQSKFWLPWLSLPFPGLGQLLLGQRHKAFFYLLATIFTYLAAIPYALGFGNYQGQGIAGLINLAASGKRIDRSIIFMIEGIIAMFFLIFAVFLLYSSFRDVARIVRNRKRGIRENNWFETKEQLQSRGFPYLVSAPALVVIVFIVLVPVITTILISFTNMDPKHQSKFLWYGLENYKLVAMGQGVAGKAFWLILGWTLVWTLCATSLAIFIGFVLALLVNQDRVKGKRIWRTIYLLPWAVPAFITIMFFSIMFAPNGPLTEILSAVAGRAINVKNDPMLTRTALICLQGWLGSAYVFLLCTGILQGIPQDLYEAAEIDGATGFQSTRHITIPLMLFQIAPLLVTQYTFNFNNYSIIALFNDGGPFAPSLYGNLAGSTDILISYIFKLTIKNQYQALGAAITVVISAVLMFVSYLGFKRSKAFKS